MKKVELSIEEIYKKKTHHEHILQIPDTYIGSVSSDLKCMHVMEDDKIVQKDITFPPGLYKIFDEVLVNAYDHKIRNKTAQELNIIIDDKTGRISIYNDGDGIDVVLHKGEKVYVPEMIFGQLLTGTNYEKKGKIVGGKNGYGAKLANIFSTEFIVETVDAKRKLHYTQVFANNMYLINPPTIKQIDSKTKPFTRITFMPDYKRFGLATITPDIISLFIKRLYDIGVCTVSVGMAVKYNNNLINIKSFDDYIRLYYNKLPSELIYHVFSDRWKVGVLFDRNAGFTQISFVNGISTFQGGTHVDHVVNQICNQLIIYIKDKNKDIVIKPSHIKENLTVFIECSIEDPSFSSQTKEFMTSKMTDFGSKCEITPEFIKKIIKTGIADEVIRLAEFKKENELTKTDFKKTNKVSNIEKLDDAHWAGKPHKSHLCRLILTEGDSAKSFALAGLSVIGREKYGVFPLRGKFMNVRDATVKQLLENKEFINLKQILGLKQNKKYADTKALRYGGIIILTDQDVDGSHIKGLLINMFDKFWPSLLKINGFIECMSTPIIKAFKKTDTKKTDPAIFYTLSEYKKWIDEKLKGDTSKWTIKYYKGLGTSDEKEAKQVFTDFDNRIVNYIWETSNANNIPLIDSSHDADIPDEQTETLSETPEDINDNDNNYDMSPSRQAIELAFEKTVNKANERKNWLFNYNKDEILDMTQKEITYSDFINRELKHFSIYSNIRAIPKLMDGLKPSQRKILYACFKKKLENTEIKVAQLGGYVSEHTEYHHGEASLLGTIINMAQNFTGSNNINLLLPNGNFGNRRCGGKDAASARYIFTQLNKLTPLLFRSEDNQCYTYIDEDGTLVEPETYMPIMPLTLINGVEGIGTGFSTFIPPFNPKDIYINLLSLMDNSEPVDMKPWYAGFTGKITLLKDGRYQTSGIYKIIDDKTVHITELPVGTWTEDYKEYLNTIIVNPKDIKKNQIIDSFISNSGNNTIDFVITFYENNLQQLIKSNTLEKKLQMHSTVSLNNMYLFNSKGAITKYSTVDDILLEFYNMRLAFYKIRKEHYIKILLNELIILKEKKRFIEHVIQKIIIINERSEEDIIADLHKYNFKQLSHNVNSDTHSYSYLTGMSLWSLTKNKIAELEKECNKKQSEYDIYTNKKLHDIWKDELKQFMEQYDIFIKEYSIPEKQIKKKIAPKSKKNNISITDKPRKNSFE